MTTDQQPEQSSKRRWWAIAAAVAAVVVVAGVIGVVIYLNQDVPEEVSLEAAVEDVTTEQSASQETAPAEETTTTTQPAAAPAEGLTGTWTVDTTIGEFSFEDATSSFVGFRIDEELASIGATQAVGRTPLVAAELAVDGTILAAAEIEADLTAIVTNNSRRDNAVQRALNTGEFPTATFVLTEPIDVGSGLEAGEPVSVNAVGELTINGVTNPIEVPMEAQLANDVVVVVGSVNISFADWNVSVPSSPAVVSVEDNGPLEMQLFFVRS
ncbi:MAG: YceI family protein [Acidimicrobiia bacterium]|nr:YceI family protein [Acidimicrobiia bacterium]